MSEEKKWKEAYELERKKADVWRESYIFLSEYILVSHRNDSCSFDWSTYAKAESRNQKIIDAENKKKEGEEE
tara:strand:- start:366 stop:581 length:216 start_codon:yes stop_codon:yes gene_type:complete